MSDQQPTVRFYYKPDTPWDQIEYKIMGLQNQGIAVLNIFRPGQVSAGDIGYECVAEPYIIGLIRQDGRNIARVTAKGPVPNHIQKFIDNQVPYLMAQAPGY
ncbi:hypothetical protein K492DRAFT_204685 [Lichtheimia hyalospora FSU 10163]|nr:hypothetical protein K492DRAFT_204685 [Lichtheimia hyalospora FSU 10163]